MDNYLDLIEFLQNSVDLDNMKFHTARTRKTAIKQVFHGSLFESDSVLNIDIDSLMDDFIKRSQQEIKQETINTYKSRITRSIEDYIRVVKLGEDLTKKEIPSNIDLVEKVKTIEVQCPIRGGDIKIDIKNIPLDITNEELEKVVGLIKFALS
jgi:hypothetical protein